MTCTDLAQIISAVATVVATLIALVTTLINICTNSKLNKEKHAAVKPIFVVNAHSENWLNYILEFSI